jgi:hypothetical protein
MAHSFRDSVRKASPKSSVKLSESTLGHHYLQIDDSFKSRPDLRLAAVKAFFRTYQNNASNLDYTIEEVEKLVALAKADNRSTDDWFDAIFYDGQSDVRVAYFLFSIFAYLRGELKSLKFACT